MQRQGKASTQKRENSSLNDRYSVLMENAVMGDNGEALDHGLRDEHSIEGVTMVKREVFNSVSMVRSDWKVLIFCHPEGFGNILRQFIEIFGNFYFSLESARPSRFCASLIPHQFGDRLACFADDHFLSGENFFYQRRQMRLGVGDIGYMHMDTFHGL
jgi:hypothetical protein